MYKKRKQEENPESVATWECPNGHWARVEYLIADGLFNEAMCPICGSLMTLGRRDLTPVRQMIYNDYCKLYTTPTRKKGGRQNVENYYNH